MNRPFTLEKLAMGLALLCSLLGQPRAIRPFRPRDRFDAVSPRAKVYPHHCRQRRLRHAHSAARPSREVMPTPAIPGYLLTWGIISITRRLFLPGHA